MSQTAALYRIDQKDFSTIADDPGSLKLSVMSKGSAFFEQTHEAFCFLLAKGSDGPITELVTNIFYPEDTIGEIPDLENADWDNLPPDFNYGDDLIFYNTPAKVADIASFLMPISPETLAGLYNADELNENKIYPCVWNTASSDEFAFNLSHLVREFKLLKEIYMKATAEEDYILSFVG